MSTILFWPQCVNMCRDVLDLTDNLQEVNGPYQFEALGQKLQKNSLTLTGKDRAKIVKENSLTSTGQDWQA